MLGRTTLVHYHHLTYMCSQIDVIFLLSLVFSTFLFNENRRVNVRFQSEFVLPIYLCMVFFLGKRCLQINDLSFFSLSFFCRRCQRALINFFVNLLCFCRVFVLIHKGFGRFEYIHIFISLYIFSFSEDGYTRSSNIY